MNVVRNTCVLLAFATLLFWGNVPSATSQSFLSNSRLVLGTETNKSASVRIGDLDGDGDLDVVVANGRHWPQQNRLFLNQGRSRFTVTRPIGSDGSTTYACELADLDGDGDLDIATGNDMAPCQIFLNDGQANFELKGNFGPVSSVRSMTIADIDRDGDQDILLTCRGRANQICLNDGNGNFEKGIEFGTKTDSTIDVEVGDVNGDGHIDLVLANRDGQANAWLPGDGSLKFEAVKPFGGRGSQSRAVVVGDFNADGKLDWAVGNIGKPNRLFLGDGTGGVASDVEFGQKDGRTYCLAAADLDSDGDLDLVAGNAGQPNMAFFNAGDGTSFRAEDFDGSENATYGICVGDLNGDGTPDIAVANSDAENRIFIGRSKPPQNGATKTAISGGVAKARKSVQESDQSTASGLAKFQSRSEYQSTDWPAFRGLGSRGVAEGFALPATWNADAESNEHKNVKWQVDIPGLGHSSPVISGDKLFLLTAVAKAGAAPLKVQSGGKPTAADDNGEQDWILLCFDKSNGKELWQQTLYRGQPRATRHAKATHANTSVCIDGDKVITFLGSEGLYCHDFDGKQIWKQDLGVVNISKYGIGWGFSSSPSVHDGKILLVCDDPKNPYLTCRNLDNGEEVWRTSRKGICERSWGTPLVHQHDGETQVVVNGWPWIVSYDLSDGKERWRINGGGDNPVPTPFEANGLIYITNAHGGPAPIHAVRPTAKGQLKIGDTDAIAWSVGKGGSYMSTPVVYNDQIYLGQTRGVVRTFHAGSGEKLGERRLGSKAGVIASLVAGDGKIYCAAENGKVYVLAHGPDLKVLSENTMDSPCLATPAISHGVIFVRSTKRLTAITQLNDSSHK